MINSKQIVTAGAVAMGMAFGAQAEAACTAITQAQAQQLGVTFTPDPNFGFNVATNYDTLRQNGFTNGTATFNFVADPNDATKARMFAPAYRLNKADNTCVTFSGPVKYSKTAAVNTFSTSAEGFVTDANTGQFPAAYGKFSDTVQTQSGVARGNFRAIVTAQFDNGSQGAPTTPSELEIEYTNFQGQVNKVMPILATYMTPNVRYEGHFNTLFPNFWAEQQPTGVGTSSAEVAKRNNAIFTGGVAEAARNTRG